jgi:hypothetical protein
MFRRIFILIVIAVLLISGYFAYQNYQRRQSMDSGSIHCVGCMSPSEEAAFKRENAGEGPDGQSEHKILNRNATYDPRYGRTSADYTNETQTPPADGYGAPPPPAENSHNGFFRASPTSSPMPPPPNSDSIAPNPPNGAAFTGRGTYQWYREGNLTWRLNTETGSSCIAYATMAEWRKTIVIDHGCAGRT